MKSDGGNFSVCAMDVLWLGMSYSSVAVWAYVIMGGAGSPSCGREVCLLLCFACQHPRGDRISPGAVFIYH